MKIKLSIVIAFITILLTSCATNEGRKALEKIDSTEQVTLEPIVVKEIPDSLLVK